VGFGHTARKRLQQLRLAGAIAADQQPALPGLDAPVHVARHRALAAIEIDAPERDGERCIFCSGATSARNYRRMGAGARRVSQENQANESRNRRGGLVGGRSRVGFVNRLIGLLEQVRTASSTLSNNCSMSSSTK
jgi:hypothetical protein